MKPIDYYSDCRLCARGCGADRTSEQYGYCRAGHIPRVARASLHFWEEPVISGERGSGTIFFSGCSLRCIYCQNSAISGSACGDLCDSGELCRIMLELQNQGAHNINFVTPTHFAPTVIEAVDLAKNSGLSIPIVYNTASYETVETVKMLEGVVDVFLADYKYVRADVARHLSYAEDYPEVAFRAIEQMLRQQPIPIIENGIMKSGVIVRLLLLPGHVAHTKLALKKIYSAFGDNIYLSLMSQYTPRDELPAPLNRRVTRAEYCELLDYAEKLGVVNGFTQQLDSASESFIPDFKV